MDLERQEVLRVHPPKQDVLESNGMDIDNRSEKEEAAAAESGTVEDSEESRESDNVEVIDSNRGSTRQKEDSSTRTNVKEEISFWLAIVAFLYGCLKDLCAVLKPGSRKVVGQAPVATGLLAAAAVGGGVGALIANAVKEYEVKECPQVICSHLDIPTSDPPTTFPPTEAPSEQPVVTQPSKKEFPVVVNQTKVDYDRCGLGEVTLTYEQLIGNTDFENTTTTIPYKCKALCTSVPFEDVLLHTYHVACYYADVTSL